MTTAGPVVPAVQLYAEPNSVRAYEIRDFLTRMVVDFTWIPLHSDAECHAAIGVPLARADLPVVVLPDGTRLNTPTLEEIASRLGWIAAPRLQEYDLSIYGAGPAGLSAAVYAASEGLNVVLLERQAVGGQAGTSSLIENYLGFPHGIRGAELAERARQQAVAFGTDLLMMREGIKGIVVDNRFHAKLADGGTMVARANICATGVEWRRLGLPGEDRLLGSGLYYGAGTGEAPQCGGEHVYVVGGANSAGQAAMNLAAHAARVTMLVRGSDLSGTMSSYLSTRIAAQPNIEVLTDTRVYGLIGDTHLQAIELETVTSGSRTQAATGRLFVCIGGAPNTEWAAQIPIARDRLGFLITGSDLTGPQLSQWPLARMPLHLETSLPGSFAAGDVRCNSVKRVASAVGEGAMAVTFAHRYLAETSG